MKYAGQIVAIARYNYLILKKYIYIYLLYLGSKTQATERPVRCCFSDGPEQGLYGLICIMAQLNIQSYALYVDR